MVGGIPVSPGVSLFWSDKCCFSLNYTGDSEVYNSPLLSDNCGLLAVNACVAEGGVAYWMSDSDFWTYNGTVQALPSDDIRDYGLQREPADFDQSALQEQDLLRHEPGQRVRFGSSMSASRRRRLIPM